MSSSNIPQIATIADMAPKILNNPRLSEVEGPPKRRSSTELPEWWTNQSIDKNNNNNNMATKDIESMPDKPGEEDPTEFSESNGMLEIPIASPDGLIINTDDDKEDTPIPIDSLPPPKKRYVQFFLGFLLLGGIVAGCVAVLFIVQDKAPEQHTLNDSSTAEATTVLVGCTRDAHLCPDGSYVGRDESNNCEWRPCPTSTPTTTEETVAEETEEITSVDCGEEVMMCSDMSTVGRSGSDCSFDACPVGTCKIESQVCPDGTKVGRNPDNNCRFDACQYLFTEETAAEPLQCGREIKMCTDLSTVTRTGPNCEFSACPPGACMVDSQTCPDGSSVGRNPDDNCEFAACPTQEPSGECPEGINPREIKMCQDLSTVTRSGPNCEFAPCP